jgi:phasin family protein
MANPRQEDKSNQNAEQTIRQASERTAEQTKRVGETAVEASQEVARVGADLLRQNAEAMQNALRFGLEMTTAVMGRSTDQVSRTLGLSGNEVQEATERSARNAATTLQSTSVLAKGMTGMSREYFAFVRHQMESSMNRMNELWACRTPQEIAAVQSDFVRETLEGAVESSRRMADMSLKAADDAAKRMAQNIERRAA